MADNLNKMVAILAENGTVATREQAERMAVRVAGSVDAYIQRSEQFRDRVAGYQPQPRPAGGVSPKFSDLIAYRIARDRSTQSSHLNSAAEQGAEE